MTKGFPSELTPLRIALLALFASAPGTNAYQIEQLIRSRLGGVRGFGKSAVYENSKELAVLGYLEEVTIGEPLKPANGYVVTQMGTDALREWMKTPTQPPRLDDEIFLRTRVLDYVPAEDALRSLAALRPHLTRRLLDLEEQKATTDTIMLGPMLELEYFELVLRAHLKWLNRAEKALKQRVNDDRAHTQRRLARFG